MKKSARVAVSVLALLTWFLAGCGSSSNPTTPPAVSGNGSNGSNTPPGAGGSTSGGNSGNPGSPGGGGGGSASTAEYLYVANGTGNGIEAFAINSDGTLTTVPGSPFPAANARAVAVGAGNSLAVSTPRLQGWTVNPQTGSISKTSEDIAPLTDELIAASSRGLVYAVTNDLCVAGHCTALGTATISNGQLGTIQELELVPQEKNPMRIALDPTGAYLYTTIVQFGFGSFLGIVQLKADGTLGSIVSTDMQICSAQDIAATANGTHTYVYVTCYGGAIELHVVDNTSGAVVSSTSFATAGSAEGMVADPSGQYLLVADTSVNTVDVFKIDPSTGNLGNAFTQTNAGTAPTVLTFDSTGKFVYVADGGCLPLDPAPTCSFTGSGNIEAFSWSGGKLTAINSYPSGGEPVSLAVFKP